MKAFLCAAALVLCVASVAPAQAAYISYRSHDSGVEAAQMRLKQMGYFVGKVDGINGPRTSNALASFQRDHGLMATGNYDYYTQAALFPVYNTTPYYATASMYPTMQYAYPVTYTVPLNTYRAGGTYAQPIAYAAQLPVANRPIAQTYEISEAVRYGNYYTPAGSQITTVVPRPW